MDGVQLFQQCEERAIPFQPNGLAKLCPVLLQCLPSYSRSFGEREGGEELVLSFESSEREKVVGEARGSSKVGWRSGKDSNAFEEGNATALTGSGAYTVLGIVDKLGAVDGELVCIGAETNRRCGANRFLRAGGCLGRCSVPSSRVEKYASLCWVVVAHYRSSEARTEQMRLHWEVWMNGRLSSNLG